MSNVGSIDDAVGQLIAQGEVIGRLAQDEGGFAAAVAAFESKDANAFRWVLQRLEMLPLVAVANDDRGRRLILSHAVLFTHRPAAG